MKLLNKNTLFPLRANLRGKRGGLRLVESTGKMGLYSLMYCYVYWTSIRIRNIQDSRGSGSYMERFARSTDTSRVASRIYLVMPHYGDVFIVLYFALGGFCLCFCIRLELGLGNRARQIGKFIPTPKQVLRSNYKLFFKTFT